MSEKKAAYRQLCEKHYIPLPSRDWWLDAVCGENWEVVLSFDKNEKINGALPYWKFSNPARIIGGFGFDFIKLPPFTANLNIWFASNQSPKKHHQQAENQLITENLITDVPKFSWLDLNFTTNFTDWLPFHWQGFSQTTRYTYQLSDLQNLETHFESGIYRNVRKNIKKAQKKIQIESSENLKELSDLCSKSYQRQGKKNPMNFEVLQKLDAELKARNCRQILLAKDEKDNLYAGGYLVWDERCAYYLFSGRDENLGGHGANTLVLWEAIKFVRHKVQVFDFEGSMQPKIEPFLRAFGGEQMPYHRIRKVNSWVLKLIKLWDDLKPETKNSSIHI